MSLCRIDRFRIVLVLLLKLLTCFLKKFVHDRHIHFLLLVLTRFGFHPLFVGCINTVLCSTMLSIRINGSLVGFFLVLDMLDKEIHCFLYFSIL